MDRLLTTTQIAARLGITPGRVRQLAQARGLGTLVTPNLRLYTEADAERMRGRTPGRPRKRRDPAGDDRSTPLTNPID